MNISRKKCLVTGGAGFIGSNIVDRLIELGNDVIVIDNESSNSDEVSYWNSKAHNYKFDIRDYDNTKTLYNSVDYVFHLAAESKIQSAIENPIHAVSVNCMGTATALQCSREAGVKRFIYSSTASGYGANPIPNNELQQDDCLNPYAVSKISGEKLCKMYSDLFNLETIIFRYFNVYGERQRSKGQYAPVIGLFVNQYKNNLPLTVVGDGSQKRDFVNVKDVVEANILATECVLPKYGEVFNVGFGKSYSILELAKMVSSNIKYIPSREGEIQNSLSDIKKIKQNLGWEPKIFLEDYIKDII